MTIEPMEDRARQAAAPVLGAPAGDLGVELLAGHASARRYLRVHARSRSVVVMVLPDDALASEEATAGEAPEELPFLSVQRYLAGLGVRVPEIYAVDLAAGTVTLEDLGDRTLEAALVAAPDAAAARAELYGRAVDDLAFLRQEASRHPDPAALPFTRRFDYELLRWELDHFREWGLEAWKGAKLEAAEREVVEGAFDEIARRLAELPAGLTHRDYQSRNLMVVGPELVVIDFQDALLGPMVYDLVALLRDSYVTLAWDEVETLKGRYLDAWRSLGGTPPEREDLDPAFDLQTVQRKLKDAGRFVFIDRVKGNADFLPHIPASLAYVREALGRLPEYGRLQEVLAAYVPELAP